MLELFIGCHHFTTTGMGALNINLAYLPGNGGILDQSYKLKKMFDHIRAEIMRLHTEDMKRNMELKGHGK